jgi:translation elongation factor EF-1alpha
MHHWGTVSVLPTASKPHCVSFSSQTVSSFHIFVLAAMANRHPLTARIQGQTRQHARLLCLLGVRQLCVGVNKMDCDVAGYKEERYKEIKDEMKHMLTKVGWKKDFVDSSVPFLPISGWIGDNLIKASENMKWWKPIDIKSLSGKVEKVWRLSSLASQGTRGCMQGCTFSGNWSAVCRLESHQAILTNQP